MITKNKKQGDRERTTLGLENKVPQNRGMDQEYEDGKAKKKSEDDIGKPVDNGGVESTEFDTQLEEQWQAVRDEYQAHYPGLEDSDTQYKKGGFDTMIDRLAKKRQRTRKEIQNEIMKWPSTK